MYSVRSEVSLKCLRTQATQLTFLASIVPDLWNNGSL